MIEATVSTDMMQSGEEKTLRIEWGETIPHDYIPTISACTPGIDIQSFKPDADGITIGVCATPYRYPIDGWITCRALTLAETEQQPCL